MRKTGTSLDEQERIGANPGEPMRENNSTRS